MDIKFVFTLTICSILLLCACGNLQTSTPNNVPATSVPIQSTKKPPAIQPTAQPTAPAVLPNPFRIIGYATDGIVVEAIPFTKLTHINYAFLIPNDDGTFLPLTNAWKIKGLVARGHQNNVRTLISIGGWGWDKQFEKVASDPQKRAIFISETLKVVNAYGFDGVDIDWEYPDPGESAQYFAALIRELRAALPEKLLSAAVISSGDEFGLGIPTECFSVLDFINVMAYDEPGHATMDQFTRSLDYWVARGLPSEKLVLGIPFYSRPGEIPYRKLVQSDPSAAQSDVYNYNGSEERYNGLATVTKKTLVARQRASGVMFWTLELDASGDASLLNAIHQASK